MRDCAGSPDESGNRQANSRCLWTVGKRAMARHHAGAHLDRKSTRLNSSHVEISYAVFCLKKKKKNILLIERGEVKHSSAHSLENAAAADLIASKPWIYVCVALLPANVEFVFIFFF